MMTTRLAAYAAIGLTLFVASTAFASAPPRGGRDLAPLQRIADARYGPGQLNVSTDYYGCHPGEGDPWLWQGEGLEARLLQDGEGHPKVTVGWYRETGARPRFPGDGVLFGARAHRGDRASVGFARSTRLGLYCNPGPDGTGSGDADGGMLFTNRLFNAPGGAAPGAAPLAGGDPTLIFDVSRWSQPATWLVWFPGRAGDVDDDHAASSDDEDDQGDCDHDRASGVALEITVLHATPAQSASFGELKQRYRK